MRKTTRAALRSASLLATTILATSCGAFASEQIPDGKFITPLAIPGANQQFLNPNLPAYPNFVAGQALLAVTSPDGSTLAVLCAGQNSLDNSAGSLDVANSTQYVFLYDIRGSHKNTPLLKQVIQQPNAYAGLVFSPDGKSLYAAGGNDDAVYVYTGNDRGYGLSATIPLGHSATHGNAGVGGFVQPNAGGLAISADGKTLVVANNYNDSISVIDTMSRTVRYEHDLRPYFPHNEGTSGVAGGEYPFAVALMGSIAYVSSDRDRQIVAVDVSSPTAGQLVARIALDGNALGLAANPATQRLYVAQDNADLVTVIDTARNHVMKKIDTRAPYGALHGMHYTGAAPISVRMDPTGTNLYAMNAGANSIAVISLASEQVVGLLPTAYEPTDMAFSADGKRMYIVNGKSNTGPNTGYLYGNTALLTTVQYPGGNAAAAAAARATNEYQFQLERSSLVSAPVPAASALSALTAQVFSNNNYDTIVDSQDITTVKFLQQHISHVIYVVKENRTFDQILGDLTNGANADASLAVFGQAITPSFHALATQFATLDNFQDPADGSMDGWSWATRGRVTDTETITQQINYAFVNRGLSYESEGSNRNIPVGLDAAGRDAATGGQFTTIGNTLPGGAENLLPGPNNHSSADSPFGQQMGFIYDAVLQAGKTVRDYGFLTSNIGPIVDANNKPIINAGAAGVVQVAALDPTLSQNGLTDVYFRGFDQNYPDLYRYNEWKREFDGFVSGGNLPNLSLVRLSHDHTGSFATAQSGVNTPETQQADDDYATGLLVQAVANSPYAQNTLIIITEDDSQDGPDHVDSHRATAYFAGAYVRKSGVVSTHYSQVNVLRTIEDIFGTAHINLNTAHQRPMTNMFDITPSNASWSFTAIASNILQTTTLLADAAGVGRVRYAAGPKVYPTHDAAYWARATRGFDFSDADRIPDAVLNRVLWTGLKGSAAYPKVIGTVDRD